MRRILNFIKVAIAALPFYVLGYLSHFLFRHLPDWTYSIIEFTLFAALIYYINKNRRRIMQEGNQEYIPEHLQKSSYTFVVMGCLIGSFLASSSFRTPLFIDNGTSIPVMVAVNSNEAMQVPAKGFVETKVPTGDNQIVINGKLKKLNLKDKGNWIFNIDNINTYLESSVRYSNPLNKDRKVDLAGFPEPDARVYNKELFKTNADYIFKAPDSIPTSNATLLDNLTKRVLSRVSPQN